MLRQQSQAVGESGGAHHDSGGAHRVLDQLAFHTPLE